MKSYQETLEYLRSVGQEQLLRFFDELDEAAKQRLLAELNNIDFSVVNIRKEPESGDEIKPHGALTLEEIEASKEKFTEKGLEAIRNRKVALVLLAGGQGTRLGIEGPKGAFNIGETRELYIFECLIRNLEEVTRKAGCSIPLMIMTSEKNDEATRAFFKEHDYFGYPAGEIRFFIQEMAPASDYDGKVFLEEKDHVALSPNGNGGWFKSLKKAGLSDELSAQGVEWLNVFAVDNVLQRMGDPAFIGATIESGAQVGSKVISKAAPDEKVGVMCYRGGRPSIVEYYELTEDMINLRDENGRLLYNWGVILNYLFRLDALEATEKENLPLHVVEKKIPHIDEAGVHIKPEKPNGYKFETLVLDMIEKMDGCLAFEVDRAKEFAPVKNMTGTDSAESARAMLRAQGVEL